MTAFLALALALQPAHLQKPASGSKTVDVQQLLPHIWRKTVSPGVMFEMVWDQAAGLTEFALRIDPKCPDVKLGCDLGGHTVYEDNPTIGRATVTEMVKADHAIAGINSDFFPFTGDPLNLLVRDGELLSLPFQASGYPDAKRAVFAWGPGGSQAGFARTQITLKLQGGKDLSVTGFDEEGEPDTLTLNNPAAGLAYSRAANAYAVIKTDHDKWKPNDTVTGTVVSVGSNLTKQPIAPGSAYLVGQGSQVPVVSSLKAGQSVTISIQTTGLDWSKYENAVGGAPILVKDGKTAVDAADERLSPSFVDHTHPRTSIGHDAAGNIWLVAVDGRTKVSKGVTLSQLADIMRGFGCTEAINLDGGGSTTFNLFGLTVNHPSDGVERPVAEGVLVYGPTPKADTGKLTISGESSLKLGHPANFRVFRNGVSVPNAMVIWQAEGAGWMDQAGVLHPTRTGTVTIHAIVNGAALTSKRVIK